ncbi:MAG: SRPBCC family protein [Nitrospinota bacterium]
MPPVVVLQKIRAPVEKVFHFIGNVETHPQFADFCREVKVTSGRRNAAGTRFHQVFVDGRECDSEIVVWEPYRKIVWHNFVGREEKPAQVITYRFEQEGEITHLLHTVETDAYEDQTLHRKGTEENLREVANLKRLLEG